MDSLALTKHLSLRNKADRWLFVVSGALHAWTLSNHYGEVGESSCRFVDHNRQASHLVC